MSEIIDGKPQIAPGFCFICELSNPVRYIDTFRDFEGVVKEKLDGRKYVCEECVTEFAEKFGFVTPDKAAEYVEKLKSQEDYISDLQAELDKLSTLKELVEHFGGKAVVEVSPTKVVAKKVTVKKVA